jgi:hypothetical protein
VPLLWRDDTTVQFGDQVARIALSRHDAQWLTALDGLRTADAVLDSHPTADRLLRLALASGALEDAAAVPDTVRWASAVERDLARARWRALPDESVDPTARDRARVAVVGSGQLAEGVRSLLAGAGLRESPTAGADAATPTIVILADAHHPDVPQLFDGRVLDGPHVHVGARGRRAVAGPIVVPGTTSCLRCAHLHACDRDSAWPMLSIQWAQTPAWPIDPLLVHLVAGFAVHLTRQFVDGCAPLDTAIEIELGASGIRKVDRPPHALCGCRWPETDPVSAGVR